jgi:hypothetical protein
MYETLDTAHAAVHEARLRIEETRERLRASLERRGRCRALIGSAGTTPRAYHASDSHGPARLSSRTPLAPKQKGGARPARTPMRSPGRHPTAERMAFPQLGLFRRIPGEGGVVETLCRTVCTAQRPTPDRGAFYVFNGL